MEISTPEKKKETIAKILNEAVMLQTRLLFTIDIQVMPQFTYNDPFLGIHAACDKITDTDGDTWVRNAYISQNDDPVAQLAEWHKFESVVISAAAAVLYPQKAI